MHTFFHGLLLLFSPRGAWQRIADHDAGVLKVLFLQTIPFALIPAVCWYYGVTQIGWSVAGEVIKLTPASAAPMCAMFFLAMVSGVMFVGFMVRWMSESYAPEGGYVASYADGVRLISYTAMPFFIGGFMGLNPILWLDIILGVAIACYCIFLLFIGVSPMMRVSETQAFLYASAVFAVALVAFVGLLTVTVLLWDIGPSPEYMY